VERGGASRQETWGRGDATAIGRAGLDHAFSVLGGLEEVVAFTEVHNARSRAVMERLGMRYVGQILRTGLIAGSAVVHKDAPFALYRITRSAYDAQQPWP
jgi:RimJ/RimL family protein N-acetyltransferase